MCDIKVGSVIDIPVSSKEAWKGIIEEINENVDPKLKYKVSFIGRNLVMFFTEEMIARCVEK